MNCPRCKNRLPAIVGTPSSIICGHCFHRVTLNAAGATRVRHIKAEPEGYDRRIDKNDCTVRALAIGLGIPHAAAQKRLADAGRHLGKGACGLVIARAVGKMADSHPRITLARWLDANPRGRWLICTSGHAMAVIDGVVHDLNEYKPRSRVTLAWRIDTQPKEPACK